MLMMNNTGNKAWLLPLKTNTIALQSGLDTFTTQHVSLVSCSDNKGQQLSIHFYGGRWSSVPAHRLGTRLAMLCFTSLCPGWEISALRAMICHPGAIMWEVKVQTFHAELRLDLACHYRCWPAVGSVWFAGGIFGRTTPWQDSWIPPYFFHGSTQVI